MNRVDKNPTKRSKKFVAGDHIVRSEYNDGVLRNNNRANNRLSKEMMLFDKAQKVVLKDLGKETQILKSKLQTSVISTPRLTLARNGNFLVEPYSVHSVRQKHPNSPRKQKQNPLEINNDPVDISGFYSNRSIGGRNGLLEPMTIRSKQLNSNSEKGIKGKKKATQKNNLIIESTGKSSARTVDSRMLSMESKLDFRTDLSSGISSKMSAYRRNISNVGESRMSFIDILAEAEEKRSKETFQPATKLTVFKTDSRPTSDLVQDRHRVTPNATLCVTPIEQKT